MRGIIGVGLTMLMLIPFGGLASENPGQCVPSPNDESTILIGASELAAGQNIEMAVPFQGAMTFTLEKVSGDYTFLEHHRNGTVERTAEQLGIELLRGDGSNNASVAMTVMDGIVTGGIVGPFASLSLESRPVLGGEELICLALFYPSEDGSFTDIAEPAEETNATTTNAAVSGHEECAPDASCTGPCEDGVCNFIFNMYGDTLYCEDAGSIADHPSKNWAAEVITVYGLMREGYKQTIIDFAGLTGVCYFGSSPFNELETDPLEARRDFSSVVGQSDTWEIEHLWTGRDLSGSTVGIGRCNGNHGVEQITFSSDIHKAVLLTHEIGHNFGGAHDEDANSYACGGVPRADALRGLHSGAGEHCAAVWYGAPKNFGFDPSPFEGCWTTMATGKDWDHRMLWFSDGWSNPNMGTVHNNVLIMDQDAATRGL